MFWVNDYPSFSKILAESNNFSQRLKIWIIEKIIRVKLKLHWIFENFSMKLAKKLTAQTNLGRQMLQTIQLKTF